MTETPSGNRWEPTPDESATPPETAPEPTAETTPETVAEASPRRGLRDRLRATPRRPLLAGAAALVVAVVGLGGFAVGRTTAPGDPATPTGAVQDDRGPGSFGDHRGPDGDHGGPDGDHDVAPGA